MKTLKVDKYYKNQIRICLIIFLLFALSGSSLLYLWKENNNIDFGIIIILKICTTIFTICSIFLWRGLKRLKYLDIVIDNDGIWHKHKGKEKGLIPWNIIASIKIPSHYHHLALIDNNDKTLLKVDSKLKNFDKVQQLLHEKVATSGSKKVKKKYSRDKYYHYSHLLLTMFFSGLGLLLLINSNYFLGAAFILGIVAVSALGYFSTATGIEILDTSFKISYPKSKETIAYSSITDIKLEFNCRGRTCRQEVILLTKYNKKYVFCSLGVYEENLCTVLREAAGLEKIQPAN